MSDNLQEKMWAIGADHPELQEAIAKAMCQDRHSIPTGDITTSVFQSEYWNTEHKDLQETLVNNIKQVRELKLKDLAQIMAELRVALQLKEVQGETLSETERTLKDIDVTALALFGVMKWDKMVVHEHKDKELDTSNL